MPNRKFFNGFLPRKYAGLGIQLIPSVIFGFLPKNQPFLQKLADFSKFCLNAVGKTVLFDLEPQYITFIQKKKFESKKSIFGYFWLIFCWIWLIFMIYRISLWRRDKTFLYMILCSIDGQWTHFIQKSTPNFGNSWI